MVILMPKKYQIKIGNQRTDFYSFQVEKSSETEFGLWEAESVHKKQRY